MRFALACFKPSHAEYARQKIAASGLDVAVFVRRTPELIRLADCCLAVSGSVSLELLYQCRPTVILYTVGRVAYRLQAWFRRVRYITLVNLLATDDIFLPRRGEQAARAATSGGTYEGDELLFPEYVTCSDKSHEMAAHITRWLLRRDERAVRWRGCRR